jgi:HAD superfamily hydrolase (TIGR01484 family)
MAPSTRTRMNPPNIKLIVCDIDESLLFDGRISEANILALQEARRSGIHIALVTGRPMATTRQVAYAIGGETYCLASYGAVARNPHGYALYTSINLPNTAVRKLTGEIDQLGATGRIIIGDHEYFARSTPQAGEGQEIPSLSWAATHIPGPISEIVVEGETAVAKIERVCAVSYPFAVECYPHRSSGAFHADWLTIVRRGGGKGAAVSHLASILGVEPSEMLAIGDSTADVAMFRVAGYSIAPQSALKETLDSATHIAPVAPTHAVAWAIRHLALGHITSDIGEWNKPW